MAFRTETALKEAPGMIFCHLDGGGMLVDRNSGEYVPAEQILIDPLHLEQIDICSEDHLGSLRLVLSEVDFVSDDDSFEGDESLYEKLDENPVKRFQDQQEELAELIRTQRADMEGVPFVTSSKGRHPDFCKEKDWHLERDSQGPRGKQIYKDRRLQRNGSGKTRARPAKI